jgi:hypothetical protein
LWAVLIVLLVSALATIQSAQAASSTYTLTGYVEQPGGSSPPPVPAGVTVDLVSRATGVAYTTTVAGGGGQFTFTTGNTGGNLAPGYWGLDVPAAGNVSLPSCSPCAVLPATQSPVFSFVNGSALTTVLYPAYVTNVTVLPYTATISGKVFDGGVAQSGVHVYLLDPQYNGLVLAQNNTTAGGSFNFKAPAGTWVLESALPGPVTQYNYTQVTLATHQMATVWTNISTYLVSGYSNLASSPGAHVPTAGNVTLYDPTNGYIYSAATPPGGYYAIGTYPGNFVSGTQEFDVILSSIGYQSSWYALNVSGATPITRNVLVPTAPQSELGSYLTTLNFTGVNTTIGNGSVAVTTTANLGNDTTFTTLANASVGQMWGQLGLDLTHSTVFPATDLSSLEAWFNASGPFFPIAQAATAINSSVFVGPTAPETVSSFASTCTTTCGLNSAANLTVGWSSTYDLNTSIAKNSSAYTLSFNFRHPTASQAFNYTVILPAGFVLAAGAQAPANTHLVAGGPDNTWTQFTLVSTPGPTPSGTAKFSIVKYTSLTANVNVSVSDFAFSAANVLNATHDNYTVLVGVGQNVTFSALNSTYPAGTNGTKFVWTFGDGSVPVTTTTATTYHTYTVPTSASNYSGSVTVTSSGGLTDAVTFFVWVAEGPVTAGIAANATAGQTFHVGGTTYYWVNWSTTLQFNATPSTSVISPGAPLANLISVAAYTFSGSGFKMTGANYSASQGGQTPGSYPVAFANYSYQFLGAGAYLSSGTVNGTSIPFLGWQYTLTVTVWDATGQSATASVVILVNDTQMPTSAIALLNANGKVVPGSGLVEGSNFTAKVLLSSANATDPNNGSIVKYYWLVTNSGNTTVHLGANVTAVRPYPIMWLTPQQTAYTVNLTVTDRAGNVAWSTASLSVSVNTTTRPVLSAGPINGPTTFTVGSTSTIWVNLTNGVGTKSVARNVQVAFFLLSPSGTGSRSYIAGAPGSVQFYNYTGGVVNTVPFATGTVPSLAYNVTIRAQITWNPGKSGNYNLYANASASNEYAGNYNSGPQQSVVAVTVNPNPTTQLLEYAAIGVAVVVVIVLIYVFYRRRGRAPPTKGSTSKSGLERSKKPSDDDEDDDA